MQERIKGNCREHKNDTERKKGIGFKKRNKFGLLTLGMAACLFRGTKVKHPNESALCVGRSERRESQGEKVSLYPLRGGKMFPGRTGERIETSQK